MIKETIAKLNRELPAAVKLVAVSKFHPFEAIEEAYAAGQRCFAESRPQEKCVSGASGTCVRGTETETGGWESCLLRL